MYISCRGLHREIKIDVDKLCKWIDREKHFKSQQGVLTCPLKMMSITIAKDKPNTICLLELILGHHYAYTNKKIVFL